MKEFKAPQQIEYNGFPSIFLAGSIDMGNSEDWQSYVTKEFKDEDVNILNPRRASWDSSWTQSFDNPQFYQQVNWELNALERAHVIIMNFSKDSKAPISLMELGLFAKSGHILVCCPDEFYRSGNVQIVCDKYEIPLYKDLNKLIERIKDEL